MKLPHFKMIKNIVYLTLFLSLIVPTMANAAFTQAEIQRLTEAKSFLMDAEKRSITDIVNEFEEMESPQAHLAIYEAIAATFRDILEEYGDKTLQSREQLLNKIRMNMAYFQFGGSKAEQEGGSELNRLIQRKLKQHLPKDIWSNQDIFHSLE